MKFTVMPMPVRQSLTWFLGFLNFLCDKHTCPSLQHSFWPRGWGNNTNVYCGVSLMFCLNTSTHEGHTAIGTSINCCNCHKSRITFYFERWLKGKFPQTTMLIGWVKSNFTNPTVKVWIWIIHLREVIMQSCVCSPLWMELGQNMWYHKRTTLHWLCT